MLTGLVLAPVSGAFALPGYTRLSNALGMSGDDGGDGSNDTAVAKALSGASDLLAEPEAEEGDPSSVASAPDVVAPPVALDDLTDPEEGADNDPGVSEEPIPGIDPVPEDDLELLPWDAVPGVIEITDFDPKAQELALRAPRTRPAI